MLSVGDLDRLLRREHWWPVDERRRPGVLSGHSRMVRFLRIMPIRIYESPSPPWPRCNRRLYQRQRRFQRRWPGRRRPRAAAQGSAGLRRHNRDANAARSTRGRWQRSPRRCQRRRVRRRLHPGSSSQRRWSSPTSTKTRHPHIFVGSDGFMYSAGIGRNRLFLSTGDGHEVDATANLPLDQSFTWTTSIADVNGDGHLDLFVNYPFSNGSPPPEIWLGDGKGHFAVEIAAFPATFSPADHTYSASAFADVNADGAPDLVLGAFGQTGSSIVLLNDRAGHFIERASAAGQTAPARRRSNRHPAYRSRSRRAHRPACRVHEPEPRRHRARALAAGPDGQWRWHLP